jgi:C4-dicarboxylate transporter DctM subunit
MFTAGLVAGLMIVLVLLVLVWRLATVEAWPKESGALDLGQFLRSSVHALPAVFLPVLILGGIYSGIQTPTESAATAVVYAFCVGVFLYREIAWRDLRGIVCESAKGSAMILFIIGTSTAFSWLFTFSGISRSLTGAIIAFDLAPLLFCVVVAVVLLIFGTFLEGVATCVLLVPVLWPIAESLGINVIHFGMIVCLANVIGTMTPPVAVNLFAASSVTGLKMEEITKGELPFFVGYTAVFFLIVCVPWFSTFFLQ